VSRSFTAHRSLEVAHTGGGCGRVISLSLSLGKLLAEKHRLGNLKTTEKDLGIDSVEKCLQMLYKRRPQAD